MANKTDLVRQYRPNYFSGFNNAVERGVTYENITAIPWAENFKHGGFTKFTVEPYDGDELIVSAHYENGEHWVVAFCVAGRFHDDVKQRRHAAR